MRKTFFVLCFLFFFFTPLVCSSDRGECVTFVSVGDASLDGSTLLAKNRDVDEAQWVYRVDRTTYPPDSIIKLQYISISQVETTHAWNGIKTNTVRWGIGMGINEWGVIIANNDAETREPLSRSSGLHDNDICRLVLERCKTAEEGALLVGDLLTEYGHAYTGEIYFIADTSECWIVEGAGHHWVAVKLTDTVDARANKYEITTEWDLASSDIVEYAVEKGWCTSEDDFNFADCYGLKDTLYEVSIPRHERTLELITPKIGSITKKDMMDFLRDHYEGQDEFDHEHWNTEYVPMCYWMTVSSSVFELKQDQPPETQVMWFSMSTPCTSTFIPVFANATDIPSQYQTGDGRGIDNFDPDSAFWVFRKIRDLVDENYDIEHPRVRSEFDLLYQQYNDEVQQVSEQANTLLSSGDKQQAHQILNEFTYNTLTDAYDRASTLLDELTASQSPVTPIDEDEVISIPALDAPVEVAIDQWGIPHIYAESVTDAYTTLGYLHARDRLYQMFRGSYQAGGRLSEIEGDSAIDSDKYYRTVGLRRAVEKALDWYEIEADSNPDVAYTLSIIDAEVNGVNDYIDSLTSETLPREFKVLGFTPPHWTRQDVLLLMKSMEFDLSAFYYYFYFPYLDDFIGNETMVSDLYPDQFPYVEPMISEQSDISGFNGAPGGYKGVEDPSKVNPVSYSNEVEIPQSKLEKLIAMQGSVMPPYGANAISGSNCWVVDGEISATGKPILTSDPHLPLTVPSVWYEAHLVVPGELDVTGFTRPGIPQTMIGHNSHLAWSGTTADVDVVDVFVEEINPLNPDQYMYNGEWRDFEIIDETIHSKGGRDISFSVKWSVHGPLIDSMITTFDLDVEDMPNLAMNWTGHSVTTSLITMSLNNKAKNLIDSTYATYYWDVPPQNLFYADDQGNIAVTCAGRFPVRSGYSGKYPVKALNDSVGIIGYIPYNNLPRSVNPSQHFIQSANQRPIDPENYGYDLPAITWHDPGYRGRRIHDLLQNDDSLTIEDMMVIQADSLDLRAQRIVPYVVEAWERSGNENSAIQSVVDALDEWDYVMDTDDAMPTFWEYLIFTISDLTFDEVDNIFWYFTPKDPVLEELIINNKPYYFDKQETSDVKETRDDILVESLEVTYESVVSVFGGNMDDWLWGNHHKLILFHVGDFEPVRRGGSRGGNETVNIASAGFGPSCRMVVDLSSIEDSIGVYPGGQSGSTSSPHYDDLLDLYYAFDETAQHYGYHNMYYYSTASEFVDSDTDDTMIQHVIRFERKAEQDEDTTSPVSDEETSSKPGGIPGFPVSSILIALVIIVCIFASKNISFSKPQTCSIH